MDSIEAQYTILGFKQNEKQQLKRLSNPWRVYGSSSSDEKMKKFVMLNNNLYAFRIKKALHDDGAITDTALFITITYLNFLSKKQTKRKKFNKQLAFEIFDRYLLCEELIRKGDSITAFLVEHNDVLYKVIKPIQTNDKKIRRISSSLQYSLQRDLTLYSRMK
jgi:hypothetical protein